MSQQLQNLIHNQKYFIDQLNSSKAYQFMCMYHYSHIGFKAAKINLGIFDIETEKLVGVLQWGRAAASNIKLDRYVKEPIKIEEYLELNRFAMADSEERNSESQAISLGIKWLKRNRPDIRLLVSYSGRVEGNYGYIYQATNWEYLGYFISNAFWEIDGREYHMTTVAYRYKKFGNKNMSMVDYLCETYHNVMHYDSKQFIYIIRLDKKLTPASDILPYPKPTTEYPIQTKITIYQKDDNFVPEEIKPEIKEFYYDPEEPLFTNAYFRRHNGVIPKPRPKIQLVVYNKEGKFEGIYDSIALFIKDNPNYCDSSIRESSKGNKRYKDKFFKIIKYKEEYPQQLQIDVLCWIDGIAFYKQKEIVAYTGVSRQAVSSCVKRKGKIIGGKEVIWNKVKI